MSKSGKQIVIALMMVFSFMSLRSIYYYILSERELKNMKFEPAKQQCYYCPITHFFLGWERAAYHIDHNFEGERVPCDEEEIDKNSMFAIDENGFGIINFEKKEVKLKPSRAHFQKGTTLWSQTFSNDSLKLKLEIENYKTPFPKSPYHYNSKMTLSVNNSFFNYELTAFCDSIAVEKLRKKSIRNE
jgi:hypothetical protein